VTVSIDAGQTQPAITHKHIYSTCRTDLRACTQIDVTRGGTLLFGNRYQFESQPGTPYNRVFLVWCHINKKRCKSHPPPPPPSHTFLICWFMTAVFCAGKAKKIDDLPMWLQYYPKTLFDTINRSGSGETKKN
jgi:hypothetical protein